jgi:hypothetical protein
LSAAYSQSITDQEELEFVYHKDFDRYGYNPPPFKFRFPKKMLRKAVDAFEINQNLKDYYSGNTMTFEISGQTYDFDCEYQYAYLDRYNERYTYVEYICLNQENYGYFVQVRGDVLLTEKPSLGYDHIRLSTLVFPEISVENEHLKKLNNILDENKAYKLLPKNWQKEKQSRSRLVIRPTT